LWEKVKALWHWNAVKEERHYKRPLLLWSEKKGDPHHKILIFNSAQLPKLQSLQSFLFERKKRGVLEVFVEKFESFRRKQKAT
jgi:hypothetical protein